MFADSSEGLLVEEEEEGLTEDYSAILFHLHLNQAKKESENQTFGNNGEQNYIKLQIKSI